MASSLQQGINAAKAGRMDKAIGFLKDAIFEEPQNADVWVWIAAIIDDLDKQEIFLEKALEIDPNNIPAQRGLAYLQKRKQDEAGVQDDHLSDHTRPISPFPESADANKTHRTTGWTKLETNEIDVSSNASKGAPAAAAPSSKNFFKDVPKLSLFEIILLGVVVVVFCFIGLLAASALFDFELPLGFLSSDRPTLATEPPYPGAFLYEDSKFFDIQQHNGVPTEDVGIPTSTVDEPIIVLWQTQTDPDQLNLIYETGEYISIKQYSQKGETLLVKPEQVLNPGLYCLQQLPANLERENAFYWCFKVSVNELGE